MPRAAVLASALLAAAHAGPADPPPLVWPSAFYANFTEGTWYQGGYQQRRGWVAYDWAARSEVIYRPESRLNPICDAVRPGLTTPCVQHSPSAMTRYLYWPTEKRCCVECTQYCGAEKPGWVDAVPPVYLGLRQYAGFGMCDEWGISSNTPDRVSTSRMDGRLCELYDGGANFPGDNPFQWDMDAAGYTGDVPREVLALPDYCTPARAC